MLLEIESVGEIGDGVDRTVGEGASADGGGDAISVEDGGCIVSVDEDDNISLVEDCCTLVVDDRPLSGPSLDSVSS